MASVGTGREGQPDVTVKRPEASLGDLVAEMTSGLGDLVRQEVNLAKVETKEEVSRAAKAGGMLGAGGLAGWMAVLFVSLAVAWLLDQVMNRGLAFAIVGFVWAVAALVLISAGRKRLQTIEPLPQTTQTLKEDVAWARAQKS